MIIFVWWDGEISMFMDQRNHLEFELVSFVPSFFSHIGRETELVTKFYKKN